MLITSADKFRAEFQSQGRTTTPAWLTASKRSSEMKGASAVMCTAYAASLTPSSFSRLYRGISAPILMEAPKRATKFAANDEWGKVYRNLFGAPKMTQSLSILTGATAGATEAFVVVPFELVKIRLQGTTLAALRWSNGEY